MPFNLDAIHTAALEEGAKCFLSFDNQPLLDEEGNPVWILLTGEDSARFRTVRQQQTTRQVRDISVAQVKARNNQLKVAEDTALTGPELEERAMERRVVCTLAWSGFSRHNEPLACTPGNAQKLYEEFPFIADQVDQFIGDRSNFLQISRNGSSTSRGSNSPAAARSPLSTSISDRPSAREPN
jgi:hypothetical protein